MIKCSNKRKIVGGRHDRAGHTFDCNRGRQKDCRDDKGGTDPVAEEPAHGEKEIDVNENRYRNYVGQDRPAVGKGMEEEGADTDRGQDEDQRQYG